MTRILLVEDEPDLADPLAYLLRREGYEVEIAEDGPYDYSGWSVVDADGNVYELDERATDLLLSSAYPDGTDEEFETDSVWGIAFVFDIPADASDLTLTNDDEGVSITLDI